MSAPKQAAATVGPPSSAPTNMVISEAVADAPTQRFYAISLFIFIQALKFYDLLQLYAPGYGGPSETAFTLKWIGIDAAYLFLIPKLRIPWLSFGLVTTIVQIALAGIINICLSARISISITALGSLLLRTFYDRELSVLENQIRVSDIVHNASRILGKHTINILPESTAKLNPNQACFCIDVSGEQHNLRPRDIIVPIRLNATVPMLIQYSRINPENNKRTSHNITGKPLKQILKHVDYQKHQAWQFPLTLSEPGLYTLDRVQDTSKLDVRLYRSQVLVVACPSAALVVPERLRESPDRCTGDLDELSLRVTGLPPLKVKYNRWIEGRERASTIDAVKPLDYTSPLMISPREHVDGPGSTAQLSLTQGEPDELKSDGEQKLLQLADVDDIAWAQAHTVEVHLNASIATAGKWSYYIEAVEDACGNVVNYAAGSKTGTAKQSLLEQSAPEQAFIEAPSYQFIVHERPSIMFRGCSPDHPVRLLEGQEAKLFFDITSREQGSFMAALGKGDVDTLVPLNGAPFRNLTFKSKTAVTTVQEAGIYTIESFSSSHCKGSVLMPSTCVVITPRKPSIQVSFDSILDQCAGSIGLLADLTFTGQPPYDIAWKVIKDGKATLNRKRIDRGRHQLRFTPEEAGHYAYEFMSLDDANYKGISLASAGDEVKKEQIVHPLAGAHFDRKETRKCCIGDSVEIPVRLVGSGPWSLAYEIIHGSKRERFELTNLQSPAQVIKTPAMTQGGQYLVSLVSVKDGNGCHAPLEEVEASIEVRRDRPSVSFYTIDNKLETTIIDGTSVDLPLRFLGDGPWELSYSTPRGQGKVSMRDANGKLSVKEAGTYSLSAVQDAYCPGTVNAKAQTFTVNVFPRPRLSLPASSAEEIRPREHVRREVCENDEDSFDVDIFGAPPFAITYERALLNARGTEHDRKQLSLNAALPRVSIKAKTSPAGQYRYTFHGVADARYDAEDANGQFTLLQTVNPRPEAGFVQRGQSYQYCLEVDLAEQEADRVPVKFVGEAPFTARFRIKHELTGRTSYLTEQNIQTHTWSLQIPKSMLTLGKHAISIAEVSDAKGCARTSLDGQVFIAISERPSILPVSSRQEFCVGDRISYALQGTAPFKIDYEFQGSKKRATEHGPVFSRIAEKPGHFKILSLADSASKCRVAVNGLDKTIHDIPSVRVSEGKTIIESIHEGDQAEIVFHLYGTPPFSLTYTRSVAGKGGRQRVLETHTVSGIQENKYVIRSSVAGTFAATEVHDRYCRISLQN
ncbi:nucleoporin Pom152 [Protomyces lactucae-debilis]|uniref:Nucleoporin Pom152 n=1 Tax=Protomyces lactucae-debilis TaxID=2754530 RepID=A0A1Y2F6M4_PROLT|nr:nucleoporin Pom152 [Protomyces lactucae-debilis]ORY79531.1 nucleoporin Pom152 [Protomyces lactucae-debilis]